MDPADFPYRVLDEAGVKAQTSIRRGCCVTLAAGNAASFRLVSRLRRSEDRLHVLLLGPPLTGKSSLAAHLEHGKRKILSVDWVLVECPCEENH